MPPNTPRARNKPLDGLRAVAVAAVVAYHLVPAGLPGGFLGVDLFFVLSGYLITGLALEELRITGRLDLARFWIRRLRRIVPALVPVVLVAFTLVLLFPTEADRTLKSQAAGAATFSTNWVQLASGGSYFAESEPPLLLHLWSLAVEEQFYLLWPLLLLLLWKIGGGRIGAALPLWVASLALGGAVLSALAMGLQYTPGADPSRLYFGTDTHGFGLLLGAWLALAAGRTTVVVPPATARMVLPAALLGLTLFFLILHDDGAAAYQGGMFAFSAVSVLVVALLRNATGPAASWLASAPLQWVGRRSYGIYLWHWPWTVLVSGWLPAGADQWAAAVVVPLTLMCAAASWRYLEQPVLAHGLKGSVRGVLGRWRGGSVQPALVSGTAAIASVSVLAGTAVAVSPPSTQLEEQLEAGQAAARQAAAAVKHTPSPSAAPVQPAHPQHPPSSPKPPGSEHAVLDGSAMTALGDSVMLAAAPQLVAQLPGIDVRAEVGRQMGEAPALVEALEREGLLRQVVVVGLGTNGDFDPSVLDDLARAVGPDRRLILVTAHGPRDWVGAVNDKLRSFAAARQNVELRDWNQAAGEVQDFADDGIHPGPHGGQVYAELVRSGQ
ncbi:peptidoglycan/LPS O-acetylase OafA/YrhL [Arthrobacter pigmenti]|uniref:Peptidoglycan/LPS O-acetylase OafA/YrhL n=1 Tax=Arthrobacter pigmenti TaxID=271432 RepID=A0A846RS66_9MICC|nr:acyltransferase family protein [Arthrobacter pigmenti]NJC23007.1 peptidoglycan/LPS O-acetylase OafA/YrhL [Arthrobacter pigmenti]